MRTEEIYIYCFFSKVTFLQVIEEERERYNEPWLFINYYTANLLLKSGLNILGEKGTLLYFKPRRTQKKQLEIFEYLSDLQIILSEFGAKMLKYLNCK